MNGWKRRLFLSTSYSKHRCPVTVFIGWVPPRSNYLTHSACSLCRAARAQSRRVLRFSKHEMTSVEKDEGNGTLTREEAAIYDRQIRLWGADAQKRMSASKVIVYGDVLSHLGNEVVKNICLSGVGHVLICDDRQPTGEPLGFLGETVEEVASNVREMNRLIEVRILTTPEDVLSETKANSVQAICVIGFDHPFFNEKVATICNESSIHAPTAPTKLFVGECFGLCGTLFLDLATHAYKSDQLDEDERERGLESVERETQFEPFCRTFSAEGDMRVEPRSPAALILNRLLEYRREHQRLPSTAEEVDDFVVSFFGSCDRQALPARLRPAKEVVKKIAQSASYEVQPISALVGGVFGREVVKSLTGKDEPLNNLFFFEAVSSAGVVEKI